MPNDDKDKLPPKDQDIWDAYVGKNEERELQNSEIKEDFSKLLDAHESKDSISTDNDVVKQESEILDEEISPTQKYFNNSDSSFQLDKRTEEKFRKGKMPIERKLDLHGLNQSQAYDSLNSFIISCFNENYRCILVVTGKGKSKSTSEDWLEKGQGILKQNVPNWLSTPPMNRYVLKAISAQPKHGGTGAIYVYLRRNRSA